MYLTVKVKLYEVVWVSFQFFLWLYSCSGLSFLFYFYLTVSTGSWSKSLSVLSYKWGVTGSRVSSLFRQWERCKVFIFCQTGLSTVLYNLMGIFEWPMLLSIWYNRSSLKFLVNQIERTKIRTPFVRISSIRWSTVSGPTQVEWSGRLRTI